MPATENRTGESGARRGTWRARIKELLEKAVIGVMRVFLD
jgi:hypothetical protein